MAGELGFDYDACLRANPLLKESDIQELQQWAQSQDPKKMIPSDMTKKQLLMFHFSCDMVMHDTKKCIEVYYSVKNSTPEMFNDRKFSNELVQLNADQLEYCLLPGLTDDGYSVMLHRFTNSNASQYDFASATKVYIMTMDRCMYERGTLSKGLIAIYDMKGVSFMHLLRGSIRLTAKFFTYVQDGMPLKTEKIHVLNCSTLFEKVMALMKPFIKRELVSLLHLHPPDTNMEEFFKNHIPRRLMPSDYGGLLPDSQTLHRENMQKLRALEPYFRAEEEQRNSCLPAKKNKSKSLEID